MTEISREVIQAAAQGDRKAFRAIYDATSGFVYSVALRIAGNTADADEVTQDAFMKIHESLKRFEGRSALKTWAYRITVNTALNFVKRRRSRFYREGSGENLLAFQSVGPEAAARMEAADREAQLAALLDRLSPDHRTCIVLREIENLSYEEIAGVLGINLNTVRTRILRAREALVKIAKKGVVGHEVS